MPNAAIQRLIAAPEMADAALLRSAVGAVQRQVGNQAASSLIASRDLPAVQRCGCKSAEVCSCHQKEREQGGGPDAPTSVQREMAVQRQGGAAPAPAPAAPALEAARPCSVGDAALAFATWSIAAAKLSQNIPALQFAVTTGYLTDNLKAKLAAHFAVDPADRAALRGTAKSLLSGYRKIYATMVGGIEKVSCGGTECEPGDYAYVYPGRGVNRVFFCDQQQSVRNLISDPRDLASTWVHEISHLRLGTDDHEYYNHAGSTSLDTATALDNADCWGNFMVSY